MPTPPGGERAGPPSSTISRPTPVPRGRPAGRTGCRRGPRVGLRVQAVTFETSETWPMTRSSVPSSRQPARRFRPFSPMAGVMVTRNPSLAGAAEARQALAGVRVERDLAHFTVADDVDASLYLLGGDIQHGLPHALFEFFRTRLSRDVRPQRAEQCRRSWQATGVGGEDAILTRFHTVDFAAGCSARMRCRISRPHNDRGIPTSCDDCHTTSSISAGVAPRTSALRM